MAEYAKAKGEYQSRYDSLAKLYEGIEGADIDAELTADLVGDYLFTDAEFVKNLSVNHRNVFQKIFDEIKYLCKIATAGSKEARDLEKVKRTFEKIYREGGNAQTDTKYRLENGSKRKYNKRSRYSETETLFLSWENGSAPVGEVKRFVRFGKVLYYQKTENGCVELSRRQFNERNGENAENTYRRAERETSEAYDYDESTQRGLLGDHNSHRDTGRNAAVFGQTIREELSDDTGRSTSGTLGYDSGNDIKQSEYSEEASDGSGASFTFSNDYATIRNFMKEGDAAGEAEVGPVSYSLSDSDGKQFAPRTRFDVFGKDLMKVEEIAPVRGDVAENAMDDIAPVADTKAGEPGKTVQNTRKALSEKINNLHKDVRTSDVSHSWHFAQEKCKIFLGSCEFSLDFLGAIQ